MGDISIIARRLKDGHVQYGYSGNGGYYRNVGYKLINFYNTPDLVEYLFGLGQLRHIGLPHSEDPENQGKFPWFAEHEFFGECPHYLGLSEVEIFSKIMFIDYGYFYDTDNKWYYINPGPFRIKIPIEYIDNITMSGDKYEFDELKQIKKDIFNYIFTTYAKNSKGFANFLKKMKINVKDVIIKLEGEEFIMEKFYDKYREIYEYFDDWILVKTNRNNHKITKFIIKKQAKNHTETINWK